MPIELHIQTKTGRCEDPEEPSTAWKFDRGECSIREMNQFYLYLKHIVRYIEVVIDEDILETTDSLDNDND